MTDQIVQLQPDSSGKKVDTAELTVGANTVQRQRVVIADNTAAAEFVDVVAKGTQGAFGIATQDMKDSGRTPVTIFFDEATTGFSTTEALLTCVLWRGLSSASATSFSVTAGKTLRITSFEMSCRSTGAAAEWARVRIRAASGTLATTSAVVASLVAASTNTTNSLTFSTMEFSDGYELAAATNFGLSHIALSTNAQGIHAVVTGFEY